MLPIGINDPVFGRWNGGASPARLAVTLVGWLTELMKNGGVDGNLETRTLLR